MTRLKPIVYLGPEGTFSDMAVDAYLAKTQSKCSKKPVHGFAEVFKFFVEREHVFAMVPIENSTEGVVGVCMDQLIALNKVHILLELYLPVTHALMAKKKIDIGKINSILSHPQPLAQCQQFLQQYCSHARCRAEMSTADAAKHLVECELAEDVAIVGPKELAIRYELNVLAEDIQDMKNNQTRFFLLGKEAVSREAESYKTSIIVATDKNVPGSLYHLLSFFNRYGLNLTRIESRPFKKQMGEYVFCIDFDGHILDEKVSECLGLVKNSVLFYKFLGSYSRIVL
ncbi:MAG: prephenate dehydratase [bacterium]